ncbi:MAG: hypothetical protein AAGA99_08940 [Actinomycetota bacterium]
MPAIFSTNLAAADHVGSTENSFVTVTGSATTHTKGAWTELIPATSADGYWLSIATRDDTGSSSSVSSILLDIGIGAAGLETVLVPDIPIGHSQISMQTMPGFTIPVFVPSGSRISARLQGNVASDTAVMFCEVRSVAGAAPTDWPGITNDWEHLGIDAAVSSGTVLGTSWTEIVASTAAAYQQIIAMPHAGTDGTLGNNHIIDVGSGAAAAEVRQYGFEMRTTGSEETETLFPPPAFFAMYWRPWEATSGTRLVGRSDTSTNPARISFLVVQ